MLANPKWGILNLDTFGWSFLMMYQSCTLEGWSDNMYGVMKTFSEFMSIYFIVLIFIGAYFLINLMLAIIKVKFSEAQE